MRPQYNGSVRGVLGRADSHQAKEKLDNDGGGRLKLSVEYETSIIQQSGFKPPVSKKDAAAWQNQVTWLPGILGPGLSAVQRMPLRGKL